MCGIAGIISDNPRERSRVKAMLKSIRHRGPDTSSFLNHNELSFGYTRLSIIDLHTGNQPFSSNKGNITVFYNGEIYNYRDLQRQLSPRYKFRSQSDGEVIAHGYAEWGLDVLCRLNGDFAIAILDHRNGCLHLARDRFGIKPLYYYKDADRFLFCSEIKGILAAELADTGFRQQAVSEYLAFQYPISGTTFFRNIHSLLPGSVLSMNLNTCEATIARYWRIPKQVQNIGFEEAKRRYRSLLTSSINLRLRSDVPLGSFLSGGLDSTAICLLAGKEITDFFTAHYPDYTEHSEAYLAAKVAAKLGGNHHLVPITSQIMADLVRENVQALEAPPSGGASCLIHAICKKASQKVRVLLDGNGGDEILAGYPRYRLMQEKEGFSFDFYLYRQKIETLSPALCGRLDPKDFTENEFKRYLRIIRLIYEPEMNLFVRKKCLSDYEAQFSKNCYAASHDDLLSRLSATDISSYLIYLLEVQDKTTMFHSIENRVPFLDHRLAEFCLTLPAHFRLSGSLTKQIARQALADLFPQKLLSAPKAGTPKPDREWLINGPLSDMMKDLLLNKKHAVYSYLKFASVNRTVLQHLSGKKNLSQRIWTFFNLAIFLEEFRKWT